MPLATACPPLERLVAMMQGQCPAAEAEPLATHIEACTVCVARLQEVSVGTTTDPVLQALGAVKTASGPVVPAWLGGLMSQLGQLPQAAPSRPAAEFATLSTLPQRVGEYRILQLLGEGGMGSVYLAEDERLGRKVALKTMKPALAADPAFRNRFQREARAVAAVEHDHIVPIYQVGEADGVLFLAMPYLKGESLDALLKRSDGPVPVPQAVHIAREAALGLQAAHTAGLVHRDIKPANLWLEARDEGEAARVRLLDFGLARDTDDDSCITAPGMLLGTPAYLAPEQARGLRVDHRADLFSLGGVLYQMLTAQRPFIGKDTMSILTSLAVDTPIAPHKLNPHCPRRLSDLTMRLLAKEPAQRPASAAAVAQALADAEAALPADVHTGSRRMFLFLMAALALVLLGCGLLFGDALYRVVTNQGVLVVEVDDQEVEVRIVQNGLVVQDKTNKRAFTLKAGKGEIEVLEKDGIKLATKQFELTRNGKTTVKVTFEELTRPAKDPDRRAAEWAISVAGVVRVNGLEKDIVSATALPKEAFRLTHVDVYLKNEKPNPWVTNEGLAALQGCKHLTFVNLSYTNVNDAGLVHLQENKNLTVLSLSDTQVGDAGLAYFKDGRDLKTLNLDRTRITDAGLAPFKDCKQLTTLHLAGTRVGDTGLGHFKNCPALTAVWLGGAKVTDLGLAHLQGCSQLERLYLGSTGITDAGLAHLKGCRNLRSLYLHETRVSDVGLVHIKEFKRLQYLSLFRSRVTGSGIDDLKKALPECRIEGNAE